MLVREARGKDREEESRETEGGNGKRADIQIYGNARPLGARGYRSRVLVVVLCRRLLISLLLLLFSRAARALGDTFRTGVCRSRSRAEFCGGRRFRRRAS